MYTSTTVYGMEDKTYMQPLLSNLLLIALAAIIVDMPPLLCKFVVRFVAPTLGAS